MLEIELTLSMRSSCDQSSYCYQYTKINCNIFDVLIKLTIESFLGKIECLTT